MNFVADTTYWQDQLQELLQRALPTNGWEQIQAGCTVLFILVLLRMLLVIRSRFRRALKVMAELDEHYDAVIHHGRTQPQPSLSHRQRLEADDVWALMARRAGIGRKLSFHTGHREKRDHLRNMIEQARTRVESLPIIGILGTILGLVLASMGSENVQAITGGMWVSLLSSLFALSLMLFAKFRYEAGAMAKLESLEDRELLVFEYVALREETNTLESQSTEVFGSPHMPPHEAGA